MLFQILAGKFTSFLIKNFLGRNASTWPGHLVLEANQKFIRQILNKNPKLKVVLIAGTNGKTTTTKALDYILKSNDISTIRNASGANLLNGFASLLIKETNVLGKVKKDALIFEVDENSLPLVLGEIPNPWALILLNLFRDQLDRYGEINTTAQKWKEVLGKINKQTKIIANSDDPQIANITKEAKGEKIYFSIPDKLKLEKTLSHAVDSTTCPTCFNLLTYSEISYSHLGNYKCENCGFKNPKSIFFDLKTNLRGSFNVYNLTAAVVTANKAFDIPVEKAVLDIESFKPAFGRQEEIFYKGKKIIIFLSKNPTGFNESLKVALKSKYSNLLLVLNDRIPDGRDISWIWDVDFEMLKNKDLNITVAGDRIYDLANRLQYAEINKIRAEEKLELAIENSLAKLSDKQTLCILPTYSAMLEIRKILTGRNIL